MQTFEKIPRLIIYNENKSGERKSYTSDFKAHGFGGTDFNPVFEGYYR